MECDLSCDISEKGLFLESEFNWRQLRQQPTDTNMKTKKVTITYQATEPKEFIYKVERYYGNGKVLKQTTASIGSLLQWFFDDLDYRRNNDGEFMPCWKQPVYNLKESMRYFGDEKIERVEITPEVLYV